jgi:uncharacterized DUF497 family protein
MRHSSRILAAENRKIREAGSMPNKAPVPIHSMAKIISDDPFSSLYYEVDTENGGIGGVLVEDFFEWDRAKSNQNVEEKGFSFYLARLVYKDRDKVVLGPGKTKDSDLIAGVIPGDKDMMVVVQVGYDFPSKRVRIISAFYSDNQKYLSKYYLHQSLNREIDKRNIAYLSDLMKRI